MPLKILSGGGSGIPKVECLNGGNLTLPSAVNWQAASYGNGRFVAIAYNSDIAAYSTDGFTWTQTTLPASATWSDITFGNGLFVAVADSTWSIYSADGITWTAGGEESAVGSSIAYGGGRFSAAGTGSTYYSDDGINWAQESGDISLPTLTKLDMTYGDGRFVVVGIDTLTIGSSLYLVPYYGDGANWTAGTRFSGSRSGDISLAYGNGKFVAFQSGSKNLYRSSNGYSWSRDEGSSSANWSSVVYGGDKFVVVATSSNSAMYSLDGITWVQSTTTALSTDVGWKELAYDGNMFVAFASNRDYAIYSYDGITWFTDNFTTYIDKCVVPTTYEGSETYLYQGAEVIMNEETIILNLDSRLQNIIGEVT